MNLVKLFLLLWGLLQTLSGYTQYENVWVFGRNAGVDFNTSPPSSIKTGINGFGEGCASVSDANGNLLFYTEGSYVWDRNHDTMPNGRNIALNSTCNQYFSSTSSSAQGTMIVPFPEDDYKYYIFSLTAEECGYRKGGRLSYSVVDMRLNNGLGDIIVAEKSIVIDSFLSERMTAVIGDSCNIWLLTVSRHKRIIQAYSITASGIDENAVNSGHLPVQNTDLVGFVGQIVVSPNRDQLVITTLFGSSTTFLYDFDVKTGLVANPKQIHGSSYGACYSPDGKKLYLTGGGLNQLDLTDTAIENIIASRINLDPTSLSSIKLGPDNKIYLRGEKALSVINYPNLAGDACSFVPNIIPLQQGTTILLGLPSLVPIARNYRTITSSIQHVKGGCYNASVVLSANNSLFARSYSWNTGDTTPSIIVTKSGVYCLSYFTDVCHQVIDSFIVTFPSSLLPIVNTLSSCFNTANGKAWAQKVSTDTTLHTYLWTDQLGNILSNADTLNDISAGNYLLRITTSDGCDTVLQVIVDQYEKYLVDFSSSDTLICEGEQVSFSNTSDAYYSNFDWDFGDGNAAVISQPYHIFDFPGVYRIRLVGQGEQCTDTAYQTIYVDTKVSDDWKLGKSADVICVGEAVTYDLPYNDSTLLALTWQLGDAAKYTTKELGVKHAYDKEGELQVLLTAHFRACPDIELYQSIKVLPAPKVFIGYDTTLCLQRKQLVLKNHFPAEAGQKYLWSTGDTVEALRILYPGKYSLRVAGNNLCTTTETIEIDKNCYVDIPNAFTPNGDGVNDYFFPRKLLSNGIVSFRLEIFNRWGELIFETKKIEGLGWDGKYNETPQPSGVYIYRVEVQLDNGQQENYQGNLTLIR